MCLVLRQVSRGSIANGPISQVFQFKSRLPETGGVMESLSYLGKFCHILPK
jgi:hypothetical protein